MSGWVNCSFGAVAELKGFLKSDTNPAGSPVFTKMAFSMFTPDVQAHLRDTAPTFDHAVLFGIEVEWRL